MTDAQTTATALAKTHRGRGQRAEGGPPGQARAPASPRRDACGRCVPRLGSRDHDHSGRAREVRRTCRPTRPPARSSVSPAASCTCATPASSASPCCSRATGRASRSWCRSPRSARSRSPPGRSSSTSATTSSCRARSSRAAAASCRSWSREWQIASKALLPLPNLHNELSEETRVRSRYLDLIARDQARKTVRQPRQGRREPAPDLRRARLHRGRDPDAAGHARRRIRPPVRDPLERVRHRAVPAHRTRAVPEARRRRRHRPGLRDQPQLPQRGRRLDALARVRDARGVRGLRRLQLDRRPHADADPERRASRSPARTS